MRETTSQPPRIPTGATIALALVAAIIIVALGVVLRSWWQDLTIWHPTIAGAITVITIVALALCGVAMVAAAAARLWLGVVVHARRNRHEFIKAEHLTNFKRAEVQTAPHATSYHQHVETHSALAAPALPAPAQLASARSLPGAIDLASLDCTPTLDHILLGVDELGQITVSVQDLCHVALLGSTGGGKSNLLRLIVPQLQKIGAQIVLADPHFAPLDPENGDDWRPIADRLMHAPAVSASAIDQELSFMLDELGRRLEKRNRNEPIGPPLFFAFDELPVICDLVKDAPGRLGKLLREGRKVQLLTIGASQSMLIKEIGGSSTIRDQYRTAFYVGGDRKSAAAMLDMPERDIDDGPLGRGVVLLRSKATAPARLVRVPLVSNASLYRLLSVAQSGVVAPTEPLSNPLQSAFGFAGMAPARNGNETGSKPDSETGNVALGSGIPTPEAARILALFRSGKSTADIVRALYGTITGTPYQKRRSEIEAVIRGALEGSVT